MRFTRLRQWLCVLALAFSVQCVLLPGSQQPASVDQPAPRGTARITSANAARLAELVRWQEGILNQVAYSPDGAWVAAATSLGVSLIDIDLPAQVQFIETGGTLAVAFSPDQRTLALGLPDGRVELRDINNGLPLLELNGHTRPVSSLLFSPDGEILFSGGGDGFVRSWRVADGEALARYVTPQAERLALSPDRQTLATSSGQEIFLWRLSDGVLLHTLRRHTRPVTALAFAPDGLALISSSLDGNAILWQLDNGGVARILSYDTSGVVAVRFDPQGDRVSGVTRSGRVLTWALANGRVIQNSRMMPIKPEMAVFADTLSQIIVANPYGAVVRLDTHNQSYLGLWVGLFGGQLNALAFRPGGRVMLSGEEDGTIWYWNLMRGSPEWTGDLESGAITSMALSADGRILATGTEQGILELWWFYTGTMIYWRQEHGSAIDQLSFSPDGTLLASSGEDGTRLWRVQDGFMVRRLEARCLAFLRDGGSMVVGQQNGEVQIWAPNGGLPQTVTHLSGVRRLLSSPDGRFLAVSASGERRIRPAGVYLFRTADWSLARTFWPARAVDALNFSHDGSLLALAAGAEIDVWDVTRGELLSRLQGHSAAVTDLQFGRNGRFLGSTSQDGSLRLWGIPLQDGAPLLEQLFLP